MNILIWLPPILLRTARDPPPRRPFVPRYVPRTPHAGADHAISGNQSARVRRKLPSGGQPDEMKRSSRKYKKGASDGRCSFGFIRVPSDHSEAFTRKRQGRIKTEDSILKTSLLYSD
ncbi:unnamed protein product [Parnassius mnemosyne]|uniref:Uncharacterized protein n=1 Tax=Parnassius mnemosyne TaxID=213953 RepID=A0AAV1LTH1_9NEOP